MVVLTIEPASNCHGGPQRLLERAGPDDTERHRDDRAEPGARLGSHPGNYQRGQTNDEGSHRDPLCRRPCFPVGVKIEHQGTSAIHIWTTRKLPGVVIPDGNAQFPEEPD
jgi:hypothetical protein